MSFGYAFGDIIAIFRLAWNVYKSYKDTPKDFQDISSEASNLHVFLKKPDELISGECLKPEMQLRLLELDAVVNNFRSLEFKFKSKRTFNRLQWV
jgi:hypothetical protein